ncbi:MAG: hypothetical protein RJA22_948 [Verrucomicrobiota bacterium]|jgi:hypothetical protein
MNLPRLLLPLLLAVGTGGFPSTSAAADLTAAIQTVRAVGPEGQGNAEASRAWQTLRQAGAADLPRLLAGMDGANDLALNWLRAAVDAVAAQELAAGRPLPAAELKAFIRDTTHHPRARRLAYELLAQGEPDAARQLVAGLRDDPSPELRRDAVRQLADEAASLRQQSRTNDAIARYQSALQAARDVDQVELLAKELKKLGQPISLPAVFGWVTQWKVIGPFDNTGGAGHDQVYPPEQRIDLAAEYDGKKGKVRWQDLRSTDDYGLVSLNPPFGALKEVAGYAYTEFHSERARPVEIRLGCKNAWKVWLNGRLLFGRDEYHRGREIDQYRLPAELKPGRNTLLVKICQNEQTERWTVEWEFQLRVTDPLGAPLTSAQP